MAVGFPVKDDYATGDVLTAANMNDFAGTLNTVITPLGNAAGKNKIINGDFNIWQRGTTFTSPATSTYTSDRFIYLNNGTGTATITQETFTPGTAPVAGYESSFFLRQTTTAVGTSTQFDIIQRMEDARTLAGQTITISFYAKADSGRTVTPVMAQNFGSGGSTAVFISGSAITLTTSWARYSQTFSIPSISGKTIGTSSFFGLILRSVPAASSVIDYWGVQVEAGSIATPFQTATGTIQGELAACQRYYVRYNGQSQTTLKATGIAESTTNVSFSLGLNQTMRVAPTSIEYSTLDVLLPGIAAYSITSLTLIANSQSPDTVYLNAGGAVGLTTSRAYFLRQSASTAGYLALSAEL